MNSALIVTLLLVAGATATGVQPKFDWPISIPDIIANLPNIIAILPELIADIIENFPGIIAAIPDIIASINWPDVIANLPGNLPEIVGTVVEIVRNIIEIIRNLDIDWDAILDLLPDINIPGIIGSIPDIIAQIPDIIANLPDIIANLPDIIANLPEIIDRIREILDNLPEIDWPAIIDLLPEINTDPGVNAIIDEYPSLVQLEAGYGFVWAQVCVGSILTSAHVLTSARCTSGRVFSPNIRRVRAGTSSRGMGGQVFAISHAINHPSSVTGPDGDISIVRISGNFIYGPTIQSIPIVAQGINFPAGLNVLYAGWGATAQGNIVADRQLHWIQLTVVGLDECRSRYAGGLVPRTITNNMFCVGRPQSLGRKADIRDAGAPVYLQGAVIGIQSFGSYINQTIPVAATSVSAYSDWIVQTAV